MYQINQRNTRRLFDLQAVMSGPCVMAYRTIFNRSMTRGKRTIEDFEHKRINIDIAALPVTRLAPNGSLRGQEYTIFYLENDPGNAPA